MKPLKVLLMLLPLLANGLFAQPIVYDDRFAHPRALLHTEDVATLRANVQKPPLKQWLADFQAMVESEISATDADGATQYTWARQAANLSSLYLMTGEEKWVEKAWPLVERLMGNEEFTNNPYAFGLTRAAILKSFALCYDFCYPAFSPTQRASLNEKLFELMQSVHMTMGFEANYAEESNWMGVRWGSVLLASYVVDDPTAEKPNRHKSRPFMWEATKRLFEHLEENVYENGWNGESVGYFHYNWSFVGPALLAFQKNTSFEQGEMLQKFAPNLLNSLHGVATATVPIRSGDNTGMKPDLSDDNLNAYPSMMMGTGFRLFPESQQPYLLWVHDEFLSRQPRMHERGWDLYTFLHYPFEVTPKNPEEAGWLNYHDPEQGITLFRNRFQDENDVVIAYSATVTRVHGHQGPDTNTFRLLGLGVPWIIGAGRTGQIAGQTNLFPALDNTPKSGDTKQLGELLDFSFSEDGGGMALGKGSCTGVEGHHRQVLVDFDGAAEAVLVVADSSENGRRLRINTPEFNQVALEKDGFVFTAPNGATLKATVRQGAATLKMETGKVRYGGDTERNNPGLLYLGEKYTHSHFVDIYTEDGTVAVVFTLQPANKKHPKVRFEGKGVKVGKWEETLQF